MPLLSRTGLLLSLSLVAGCAAASGTPAGSDSASCSAASCSDRSCAVDTCVPAFCPDGRLRRDVATDAPVFVAAGLEVAARAPRFNDDGTVGRDSETGSPLYEEVSDGHVVRVLVSAQ